MPELLDKRLVFVTGKGGVGKSTISISLGLAAAARGKRTIVCEIGGQETASRAFRRAEIGFHEVEVADNLWAISIDPDQSLREYLLLQLKVRAMRDMLVRSRIFNYLAAATPGLKELVTIGKIWELAQPDRRVKKAEEYDLVIVDAPATGHGIGFLQTPRTFAGIARVGPIHSQAQELDRFITDHDTTGVAIVSLPEEMPVNESASLEESLTGEIGMAVDRIYMNALYPERFSKSEGSELERALDEADGPRDGRDLLHVAVEHRLAGKREPIVEPGRHRLHPLKGEESVFARPVSICLRRGRSQPRRHQDSDRSSSTRTPSAAAAGRAGRPGCRCRRPPGCGARHPRKAWSS